MARHVRRVALAEIAHGRAHARLGLYSAGLIRGSGSGRAREPGLELTRELKMDTKTAKAQAGDGS